MRRFPDYRLATLRGDLLGGMTAAVVALPLSLAYGVASGMGAAAGLYGAIAVGFFAAVFGGTQTQVSGPTAPMAIVMAVVITSYAKSLPEALTVVVLAGLLQVLLGVLRLGRFVAFTPYVVVTGFMSGIGVLVMAIQVLPFLGSDPVPGGAVGMLSALPRALARIDSGALAIGCVTLAFAIFWPPRLAKYLPGPLAALIPGTLLGTFWLHEAPVVGPVPAGLPIPHLELPSLEFLARAVEPALMLALIGSVVSLLTCLVADSLTRTSHDPDRELIGQGIGNAAAGLVGGLPGAGTPVYTVPNIRAGGVTRAAGAVFALLLLALLLGLGPYVESIPLAALAAVLMKVGWDLVDWHFLTRLHRVRRDHVVVMLTTLGLAIFVDLVSAVALGLVASGLARAAQLEQTEHDSVVSVPLLDQMFLFEGEDVEGEDPFSARVGMVALKGSLTVTSSRKLVRTISMDLGEHEVVVFDFSGATFIDDSAAMLVKQLIDIAIDEGTPAIVMGVAGEVAATLGALDALQGVPRERIVEDIDEARQAARRLLGIEPPATGD
ncbi:MAG: SulP family inorganic anion transporter [Immundisolibacterales bacterium]|nr:SulP family inorganic anion transporter [Immundisolibacterales bacterium]